MYAFSKSLRQGGNDKQRRQTYMDGRVCLFDMRAAVPPDPTDPGKLSIEFTTHKDQHLAAIGK